MMKINRQKGFSLIELMIALVLGLMVSGAVLQAFIYNNRSVLLQREAISLQEQGRATIEFITRHARMAGFQENDLAVPALGTGVNGTSSTLTIEYQAGDASTQTLELFNCLGEPLVSAGWVSVNTFTVSGSSFVCNTQFRNSPTGAEADASDSSFKSAILIENIRQFSVLYGEDDPSDADEGTANRYVAAPADWENVVALKICLILESESNVLGQSVNTQDCQGNPDGSTRKLRRQVNTTIALRNRTGG